MFVPEQLHTGASPEFKLVCAACGWPTTSRRALLIESLVAFGIDWDRVVAIAARHRVRGLISHGLLSSGVVVPESVRDILVEWRRKAMRDGIRIAGETIRLQKLFKAQGIDIIFVKGAPLAKLAFGNLGIKTSIDIDALVAPRDIRRACDLLSRESYVRLIPDASIAYDQLDAWVERFKETAWANGDRDVEVDLHGRLASNANLGAEIGMASPRVPIELTAGHFVETLREDVLFGYLCIHGAQSGWSRLKWLVDVAAMLSTHSPAEIETLYRFCEAKGIGRCAAQALLLCAGLFGTDLGDQFGEALWRSRIHRSLARLAMTSFAGKHEVQEYRLHSWGGGPVLLSQFLLKPGTRYKLSELKRKVSNPPDRFALGLPAGLSFLYSIIALVRGAGRLLGLRRT